MKKQAVRRVSIVGEYFIKPGSNITCAAIGNTSCGVYCCGDDNKTVSVWTGENKAPAKVFTGHSSEVTVIAFTKDEKYTISGSQGGTVIVWDLENQKAAVSLREHRIACTALGVPSGNMGNQLLATGSQDTNVKIWDLRTGKSIYTLKGHDGAIQCVCFSPSNEWVASGDE